MNVDSKKLNIDFLYLDLNTCERCKTTDTALDEALSVLSGVFQVMECAAEVNKVEIQNRKQAEQYQFYSSPAILLNGVDIFGDVEENDCQDCGDLCGCAVDCRTFTYKGKNYEQPPVSMIVEGILRVLLAGEKTTAEQYVLPKNLDQYFTALEKSNTPHANSGDSSKERITLALHIGKNSGCDCSSDGCC